MELAQRVVRTGHRRIALQVVRGLRVDGIDDVAAYGAVETGSHGQIARHLEDRGAAEHQALLADVDVLGPDLDPVVGGLQHDDGVERERGGAVRMLEAQLREAERGVQRSGLVRVVVDGRGGVLLVPCATQGDERRNVVLTSNSHRDGHRWIGLSARGGHASRP